MGHLRWERVDFRDTMTGIGIDNHDTLRCCGRLRAGAQRFRQPPIDILGQWTCMACGQERVWLVKNRCFRCGCPKGHEAPQHLTLTSLVPWVGPSQRSAPRNPTHRPNQRHNPKPVPPTPTTQNFPPLNHPLLAGPVDASASCSVPRHWLLRFCNRS